MEKCSTGILGLDHMIDGGIPLGKSVLVTGGAGTGKTILGIHFLLEGVKRGEQVALITLDEKPEKMIENASQFGWDLSPYLEKNLFHFIDASQNQLAYSQEPIRLESGWEQFYTFISENNIQRLVIDPFRFEKSTHQDQSINTLLKNVIHHIENHLLCTSLILMPITQEHRMCLTESIWTSGSIQLESQQKTANTMHRYISIQKMRGSNIKIPKKRYFIKENDGFFIPSYHLELS